MKNNNQEETPLASIERNAWLLVIFIILSAAFDTWGYFLLKDVNPMGFLVLIPGAILTFQTLWLLLHPFAKVYEDKIEIRQSFLHSRMNYFVDIKKITQTGKGKIYITYNDDEVEKVNLFGIRESHRGLFRDEFQKHISMSLLRRS